MRELDRSLLEHKQQLASLNDELSQCKEMIGQKTAEERQLQARINSQAEERDRAQQQVHQLSKQVLTTSFSIRVFFSLHFNFIFVSNQIFVFKIKSSAFQQL